MKYNLLEQIVPGFGISFVHQGYLVDQALVLINKLDEFFLFRRQ